MADFNSICQKYIDEDIATMSDEDADELIQQAFFDYVAMMHMESAINLDEESAVGVEPKDFATMMMKSMACFARMDSEWMA